MKWQSVIGAEDTYERGWFVGSWSNAILRIPYESVIQREDNGSEADGDDVGNDCENPHSLFVLFGLIELILASIHGEANFVNERLALTTMSQSATDTCHYILSAHLTTYLHLPRGYRWASKSSLSAYL